MLRFRRSLHILGLSIYLTRMRVSWIGLKVADQANSLISRSPTLGSLVLTLSRRPAQSFLSLVFSAEYRPGTLIGAEVIPNGSTGSFATAIAALVKMSTTWSGLRLPQPLLESSCLLLAWGLNPSVLVTKRHISTSCASCPPAGKFCPG